MKRFDRLFEAIKKQLFPYSVGHDIERSFERWSVEGEDCLAAWVVEQLRSCRKRHKCEGRGLCVHYGHADLAKRNFEICREIILLMENGEISCRPSGSKTED